MEYIKRNRLDIEILDNLRGKNAIFIRISRSSMFLTDLLSWKSETER